MDANDHQKRCMKDLETSRQELNNFLYAVSHDLSAPLRGISGYTEALQEDYAENLDEKGKVFLARIGLAGRKLQDMMESLLRLSRLSRAEIRTETVDLSGIVRNITERLSQAQPERAASLDIQDGIHAVGDGFLLTLLLEHLIGNAWKFSGKKERTLIRFGVREDGEERLFFVEDNGAGFNMSQADMLFKPFRRLHSETEFPGLGMGLATIFRIINLIGGSVWGESREGEGATFYFTLG